MIQMTSPFDMKLVIPDNWVYDPGHRVPVAEREEMEKLYRWPRPERKTCKRESTNDRWRLGKF